MNKAISTLLLTHSYLKKHQQDSVITPQVRSSWALEVLKDLNFEISTHGASVPDGPVIFVANHISYIDIPLLMATLKDCSFVSKREISWWPLFGSAAKKIGTVFVDRSSRLSRANTRIEIERQLRLNKKKIVIFPSGTTSISGEKTWRKGVFEIAQKLEIPVQPLRIDYSHLRTVAYIDRDFFPYHLFQLARQKAIKAEVEVHKPIIIRNVSWDIEYCRRWCTLKSQSEAADRLDDFNGLLTEA